jgi:CubicO group peptidase (beta-lactamase class C family)
VIVCLWLTLAGFSSTIHAQPPSSKLSDIFERYHASGQFDGSALVAKEGNILYQGAFDLQNVAEKLPNRVNTPFRIASVTKGLTAVLVLQAAERGELNLDANIAEYLPELKGSQVESITVDQLLANTSGIVDFGPELQNDESLRSAICRQLHANDLASAPGEEYAYCNVGYTLLGCILESATGMSYATLLEERILTPAGMEDTYVDVGDAAQTETRALGYRRENGQLVSDDQEGLERFVAAGAVVSTVADLHAFSQALAGDQLLSAKSREKMLAPAGEIRYGCRNITIPTGDRMQVFQGGMPGATASLIRINDGAYTIVYLENLTDAPSQPLARELIQMLLRGQ